MSACPCCAHTAAQVLPEDPTPGVALRACQRCGHVWSLAPGRLRALHHSNAVRHGQSLPTLPGLPMRAFAPQGLLVLIASARFASAIRQQLAAAGVPAAHLFDLSDVLGPLPAAAAA